MAKSVGLLMGVGIILVLGILGFIRRDNGLSSATELPAALAVVTDNRFSGLPTEKTGFAPHGWIEVLEPPANWNPEGTGVLYPICPRPEWFPYKVFVGPPVPAAAVLIDPTGYMFATPHGIRVHRDGWVVTEDGRAFRAQEKLNDMGFPQLLNQKGE